MAGDEATGEDGAFQGAEDDAPSNVEPDDAGAGVAGVAQGAEDMPVSRGVDGGTGAAHGADGWDGTAWAGGPGDTGGGVTGGCGAADGAPQSGAANDGAAGGVGWAGGVGCGGEAGDEPHGAPGPPGVPAAPPPKDGVPLLPKLFSLIAVPFRCSASALSLFDHRTAVVARHTAWPAHETPTVTRRLPPTGKPSVFSSAGTFHWRVDRAVVIVGVTDQRVVALVPTGLTGNDIGHPKFRIIVGLTDITLKSRVAQFLDKSVPLVVSRVGGGIDGAHINNLGIMGGIAIKHSDI